MIANVIKNKIDTQIPNHLIEIDFLYLDLTTCTRCVGSDENLKEAIAIVSPALALSGKHITLNHILIDSEETAVAHQFVTSPTVRVNGRDIAEEMKESQCDTCTDLCGCEEGTDCRVWVYQGEEFNQAPTALIVEAIMQAAYRPPIAAKVDVGQYKEVPINLQRFFSAKTEPAAAEAASCCSTSVQQSCCEPTEKPDCCGDTATTELCGCQ
jgi:hypothetical protein